MTTTSHCGEYDLSVMVPSAAPDVQDRYLYEHLRGHLIGRDSNLPPLHVYISGHFGKMSAAPPGVLVSFRSQHAPRPHSVKLLGKDIRPPCVCIRCGKRGTYVGLLDTIDVDKWENGVHVQQEIVQMPGTYDATNSNVVWWEPGAMNPTSNRRS